MYKLTKRFRLVWDEKTKMIIKKSENVTYTNHPCFEADTLAEIEAKVTEMELIENPELTDAETIK